MTISSIEFSGAAGLLTTGWGVSKSTASFDEQEIKDKLLNLERPCFMVQDGHRIGVSNEGYYADADSRENQLKVMAITPPLEPEQLGDPGFKQIYGSRYAYYTGAMANGIASEEMIIALGKEGILGSFGAGGLTPDRLEKAIYNIHDALPSGPYAFNLIHSPNEPALEKAAVDLYLKYGVHCVEAAAFIGLTPFVVYFRAAGLDLDSRNQISIKNKIIAKISRREVAIKFMEPAPEKILNQLLDQKLITTLQADLARKVPMADDITAEADSGGHTDNRPLVSLLPSIIALRDRVQDKFRYETPIRVGAAGGISTPASALAAFVMGADYVVTGTVNQACMESGASSHSKKLLAEADMADVTMAPAADMFEMGVKLQVLKRGTFFPMRAQKLYDLYKAYSAIEEIPEKEREKLEKQFFHKNIDAIWEETKEFFSKRDPAQIKSALGNPKKKMALIFRWYLGLASHWANTGEQNREMDYQIWCGPSIGAFNAWTGNSYLEDVNNRKVVDVAKHIMKGAAFLYRMHNLKTQGMVFPASFFQYHPHPFQG